MASKQKRTTSRPSQLKTTLFLCNNVLHAFRSMEDVISEGIAPEFVTEIETETEIAGNAGFAWIAKSKGARRIFANVDQAHDWLKSNGLPEGSSFSLISIH